MNNFIKIFLAYHKESPLYKSDLFQPIKVGGGQLEGAISDDTGENISELNPYYCELTGQYWVLKNYLKNCSEKYTGFAHYRRLPDLIGITENDAPSIYGINYTDSLKLFNQLNSTDLTPIISKFDVIVPCTNYMYKTTVNPILRKNEQNFCVYDHFKEEHNNNLLDTLRDVIGDTEELNECYKAEKSLFYNIYVMKTDLMISYLEWLFDILSKVGEKIGGWQQEKYLRMAGFLSETLINVWLKNNPQLKIGYTPIYMVNFEAEYITKANELHSAGNYKEEILVLRELLQISSDKYNVASAIAELSKSKEDILTAEKYSKTGDDFYNLALISQNCANDITPYLFKKAIEVSNDKSFALSYLKFTEKLHNIDESKKAWDEILRFELTEEEKKEYEKFIKIYNLVH